MALLMDVIGGVRKLRAEQGVNPTVKVDIRVATGHTRRPIPC